MKLDEPVTGGPCWTELGTSDLEAAKRFYTELFGWRPATDPRQEAAGYSVAHLGDAAVAALSPLYQESQPVAWNVSFAVSDVDAAARTVRAAGGTVVLEPMDVFDIGRFAVALDPDGAAFQLWQARTFPGAGLFNAPGALGWVELRDHAHGTHHRAGRTAHRGAEGSSGGRVRRVLGGRRALTPVGRRLPWGALHLLASSPRTARRGCGVRYTLLPGVCIRAPTARGCHRSPLVTSAVTRGRRGGGPRGRRRWVREP